MGTKVATHDKMPLTIVRVIKTPLRAISKALDLYAKSVTNFSNTYHRPLRTMEITLNRHQFPRSFSTGIIRNNEEPPEGALVRSISTVVKRRTDTRVKIADLELYMIQHQNHQLQSYGSNKVPSCCSLGMGKIDEDRVSSFRDDNIIFQSKLDFKDKDLAFSRSRTYNRVSTKGSIFV